MTTPAGGGLLVDHSLIGHTARRAADDARWAEGAGFDGVWATESVTDAFLQCMGATLQTRRVGVGTAIAVAFARNPMTVAYAAWDLAACADGRFVLGMGTQVRAHVERRFSMPWSDPVERLADYLDALADIWACWRQGTPLRHEGPYYRHSLMTPVFTPPHHDHPIPVAIAAVGPRMTELAGRACDGAILHGMTTVPYLDQVTLPALARGLAGAGRDRAGFFCSCPIFMVMGDTQEEIAAQRSRTRDQVAFYASTPAYREILASVGYGDLQPELQALSRAGRWAEMGALVEDPLLDQIAVTGRPEDMPALVRERYGTRIDRVSSYFGWPVTDPDRLAEILSAFRRSAGAGAGAGAGQAAGGAG